jgi:hypothetical protein
MVTGGDDKKVNMWAIGKPHAILVRALAAALTKQPYGRCTRCHARLLARTAAARSRTPGCCGCALTARLRAAALQEPDGPPERGGMRDLRRSRGGGGGGRRGWHAQDVGPRCSQRRAGHAVACGAAGAASCSVAAADSARTAAVVRTLTGHRASCVAVDFHPHGARARIRRLRRCRSKRLHPLALSNAALHAHEPHARAAQASSSPPAPRTRA